MVMRDIYCNGSVFHECSINKDGKSPEEKNNYFDH